MKSSDYIGLAVFVCFGLWWVLFPRRVWEFYCWFHSIRRQPPRPVVIRLIGCFWVALVLGIFLLR